MDLAWFLPVRYAKVEHLHGGEGSGMTWPGLSAIHGSLPSVRVGDSVVPAKATWHLTGDEGAPDAAITFEMREGRPECTRVLIEAKPDGREIRTSDVASLRLEALAISVLGYYGIRAVEGGLPDLIGVVGRD